MKTVCSTNMPLVEEAFSTLGETCVIEGRSIGANDVRHADLLATRSTTKVNEALLDGSRVRFVGTATIGTDHLDINYLERRHIAWCYAPGCNANSVSEYVAAALLSLSQQHARRLEGKTMGIIGVGNVGSRVVDKAKALGMIPLLNDPPRERTEGASSPDTFVALDRILAEADIVTLHVPLTTEGPDATRHIADADFFRKLKPGAIFLNCARGATTDTNALLSAIESGHVAHTVIDTWEGEPTIRQDLLSRASLATPHIAGHSFEGKVMGTAMVYRQACRFIGIPPAFDPMAHLPPTNVPHINLDAKGREDEDVLHELVRQVYDISADDMRLRSADTAPSAERAACFDRLRKTYPIRREFRFTRVSLANASRPLQTKVKALGFELP